MPSFPPGHFTKSVQKWAAFRDYASTAEPERQQAYKRNGSGTVVMPNTPKLPAPGWMK